MTKEEIRNMVNDAINECIQETINAYKEGLNKAVKEKDWSRASEFEACIYDYDNARECIIPVVDEVFDKIEVVNDSPYKEMWEELKKRIASFEKFNSGEETKALGYKLYHLAYEYQTREEENNKICRVMEALENERGIE